MKENLLQQDNLTWTHYSEDEDYPFPVSYWGTILDIDDAGHLSVLYRWDPEQLLPFSSALLRHHLPRARGRAARENLRKWRTGRHHCPARRGLCQKTPG